MTAIEFENISKQYQLGKVGTSTLSKDLNRWWAALLGKEDPYLKIGQVNNRAENADGDFVWALRDINFKVEQGDVVGIIGKNGSGKSTLLKILSKVTSPTTGRIRGRGRVASLLEVGTGFHPEMTGRENIYMNGAIMGMSKREIDRKLDEIVDFAGVQMYVDTPVKRYSSGMMVRLGFAVAAHLEPEILVVDEVLAVGDAEFQKKAIGKMQDVSKGEGRTVLFVSHNMAAVRSLCNNGIVLKDGMVDYIGTADDCVDYYMKSNMDKYFEYDIVAMPRGDKTNGVVKFVAIDYLDVNNERITPQCGHFLRIRIKINVVDEGAKSLFINAVVRNMMGDTLLNFESHLTMPDIDLSGGMHFLYLDIPRLPLTQGCYRLSLWTSVKNNGVLTACADYLDNTIKVEVIGGDFFLSGKQIDSKFKTKVVLCEHKWMAE